MNLLNLQSLRTRREFLCQKFAEDSIKNGTLSDLFKLRGKKHVMKIRKENKYEINHANTTRNMMSPIIYMQNLLNKKNREKQEKFH